MDTSLHAAGNSASSGAAALVDTEPLTKAKLFSNSPDNNEWREIGVGVVSIQVVNSTKAGSKPRTRGGKVGKAEPNDGAVRRIGKLVVMDYESPHETLLNAPLVLDDVYTVQQDMVIVWSDPNIGQELACSFNCKEGCDKIYKEIQAYQRYQRSLLAPTDERVLVDTLSVTIEHLPAILECIAANEVRFGLYVRERSNYCKHLCTLFESCQSRGDTKSMEQIARIVVALLHPPYNSEGKIIAQFVDVAAIDKCIDIVQYAVGRRDAESGFVSREERLATFKDPCNLPENLLARVHLIFACNYLKDLLPLSLEEGDAMSPSMLNTYLLRFKLELMEEVAVSSHILPRAIAEATEHRGPDMYPLADFIHDMTRTVKNAAVAFTIRESVCSSIVSAGVYTFANAVLDHALTECASADKSPAERTRAMSAVQVTCEAIGHCAGMLPKTRDVLLGEATTQPGRCTLTLLMEALTVMRTSWALQAVYDAILGVCIGIKSLIFLLGDGDCTRKRDVLRFWVEGNGVDKPPVFLVAAHAASTLQAIIAGDSSMEPGRELSLMYCLKTLQLIVEETADLGRSFMDVLVLSGALSAMTSMMSLHARRYANIQSSIVSFLNELLGGRSGEVLSHFDNSNSEGGGSLLEQYMAFYLACCHRNNLLSASLANFFMTLCNSVHNEKLSMAPAEKLSVNQFVHPLDDSTRQPPDQADTAHTYHSAVSKLMERFGDKMRMAAPLLAERMVFVLEETPEQAMHADHETSSIASTMDRPVGVLSEFDAMAVEFGVDMTSAEQSTTEGGSSRSRSRSPSASPTIEPITSVDDMQSALRDISDDSFDELDLDMNEEEDQPPVATSPIVDLNAWIDNADDDDDDDDDDDALPGMKHQRDGDNEESQHEEKRQKSEETPAYVWK